jgi:hypothetical protein
VDDIKQVYKKLSSKGIRFHRTPDFIGEDGEGLADHGYVYFRGPDNEVLEFIQPPGK